MGDRVFADVFKERMLERLVVIYGTCFPIQKGKWRVIQRYISSGRLLKLHRPGQMTRVRRGGFTWDLDVTDFVDQWLYLAGAHEQEDLSCLMKAASNGAVAFDIGAHIGVYSLALARAVAPDGVVHAFEPNPATFERLQLNVLQNGVTNIRMNQLALGSAKGQSILNAPSCRNTAIATLATVPLAPEFKSQKIEVPMISLDEYCKEHEIQCVDIIKIDCQGYEPWIIAGATNLIRKCRPRMLIEYEPSCLTVVGSSGKQLLKLLRGLGYELYREYRGGLVPVQEKDETEGFFNLHCIPSPRVPPKAALRRVTGHATE